MLMRTITFIVFIVTFFSLVALVGKVYATSFKLSSIATKSIILAGLLVPLFFILSIISGRNAQWMSDEVYTLVNAIAGVSYYLFLGGILLSIIFLITNLTHTQLSLLIPRIILIVSLSLGVIGLLQARTVTVKRYTVSIPNISSELEGKTAVLVTDTHFGLVNKRKFSDKVVQKIIDTNPDFVLHAGDFYDGPKINTTPITASWRKLTQSFPVFYAPGNHEMYGDYNTFIDSIRKADVTVLDNKVVTYKGLQIAGITYYEGRNSPQASETIKGLPVDPSIPSILINHPPTSLEAANEKGFSLMVSGHTHKGQFWPNNYITRLIYGVYNYGLHPYENMKVLTSSGVGTFGPPIRLLNTPEVVEITFTK
jgi:uncharacterized protein